MAHHNTVSCSFSGSFRDMNEAEARQHQRGQGLRVMSRWAQFGPWLGATERADELAVVNLTQGRKLYHLGVGTPLVAGARQCAYTLYETLIEPLSAVRAEARLSLVRGRCDDHARTKAAIKHIGLAAGHLSSVTDGQVTATSRRPHLDVPAGSVVVADRAYLDFKRCRRGAFRDAPRRYRVTREHHPGTGVRSDDGCQRSQPEGVCGEWPTSDYVFVTNNTTGWPRRLRIYTRWRSVFQVDPASGAGRGPVEERRHDGFDVHVPAVGVPEVRHAVARSLHQMLRWSSTCLNVGHSRTCSRRRRYRPPLAPNCRWRGPENVGH